MRQTHGLKLSVSFAPIFIRKVHFFGLPVDILEADGVRAMLRHGEWASERAASSYATFDEMDSARLQAACAVVIDLSDDDR